MRTFKFLSHTSSLLNRAFGRNGISPTLIPSPLLCSISEQGEKDGIGVSGLHGHYFSSAVETSLEFEKDQPYDDGKTMEKEAALHLAISRLAGDFDKESMLSLRRFFGSRYAPVISTGSLKLDLALGIGGLPKGRIVEIFGKEASGKTTLALHIIREAQKLGGYCAYLDIENAMDPSLADAMGVDTENLLIARPNSAENSLGIVDTLINSGSVDVVVVDSVAALVPECEIAGVIDITSQEIQSRLMNRALRKIHFSLCRSQTLLILVNQVRSNLRSIHDFGHVNEVTCGGNAIKFYSAIRLRITRDGLLQTGNEITGIGVSVQVVKNKLAPAMKKAGLNIRFGRGFFREAEVLEMASELAIVLREGEGYWIEGEFLKDKPAAEQYLVENEGVADELVRILRSQLTERRR